MIIKSAEQLKIDMANILSERRKNDIAQCRSSIAQLFSNNIHPWRNIYRYDDAIRWVYDNDIVEELRPELESLGYEVIDIEANDTRTMTDNGVLPFTPKHKVVRIKGSDIL